MRKLPPLIVGNSRVIHIDPSIYSRESRWSKLMQLLVLMMYE